VFETATQQRAEGIAIERIDRGQSHSNVLTGRIAIRRRAMCTRRAIEMTPRRCT